MDSIFSRRSIRRYSDRPVAAETVDRLLAAAMAAPSAGNQQPWQFLVIRERATLDAITNVHPHSLMLRQAPLAIVVCADHSRSKYPVDFWVQDCAAATENILLAATAAGLGSCWLGVHPVRERVEAFSRLLGLPAGITPFAAVAIGYAAEKPTPMDRFDKARIHYEKW